MTKAVKTMVANLARLVYRMLRYWLLMVFSTCTFSRCISRLRDPEPVGAGRSAHQISP